MSEQTPDPASKVLARRRLLRGTFAAPAVLTMYSGGALAATSATCVAKAQGNPQTGEVTVGTTGDTYLRVQLSVRANNEYWLLGSRISAFTGAVNIVPNGTLQRFGALTEQPNYNQLFGDIVEVGSQGLGGLGDSTRYAALRFDATGTLVGVGAGSEGSAITGSCWTSAF